MVVTFLYIYYGRRSGVVLYNSDVLCARSSTRKQSWPLALFNQSATMKKINMTKSHFNLLQISIQYTYGPISLWQTSYSKRKSLDVYIFNLRERDHVYIHSDITMGVCHVRHQAHDTFHDGAKCGSTLLLEELNLFSLKENTPLCAHPDKVCLK